MPSITSAEVERMEGPDPATDTECLEHGVFQACKQAGCAATYCDRCNPYIMEAGRGLCPKHGARAYADELYYDSRDQEEQDSADADARWDDREVP